MKMGKCVVIGLQSTGEARTIEAGVRENCCPMGTLSKTLKRQKLTRPSCTMITVFNVGKSPILKAHKHLAYERAGPRLGGQTKGRTPIVGQQRLPLRNPLSDLLG